MFRYLFSHDNGLNRATVCLIFAALIYATTASAQYVVPSTAQTPGTIRVQINLGGPVPVPPGEDQKKQIESARVQIYENARKECDQLSLSFDAHCRLVTLNINVNNQIIGTTPTINANGFAVYELDPEPQTSPRRR
jgi:hypothetical protein